METLSYQSLSCKYCGRTLTKEEEGEWYGAWETGACPSCGRVYDPDLEARVERLAQDPEVIRRTRRLQLYSVGGGLLLIAAVFLLHHSGIAPRQLLSLIIPGVVLAIYGAFYSPRKQARTELTQERRR
jgi:NAD-dependent SIR2 family protein deacetylase